MNKPDAINQTTFHVLYVKYKKYSIPAAVILACFFLILFIIIPQFQNWQTSNEQTNLTKQKLESLNRDIDIISKIDTGSLNNNLQLTAKALPADKDFLAIIDSVMHASIATAVALDDFTFRVGELGSQEPKTQTLQLELTIKGSTSDVNRFILALEKQLPLSDITNIQINGDSSAQVTVIFYYEPFPKLNFDAAKTIAPLTDEENATLQALQQRSNSSAQ